MKLSLDGQDQLSSENWRTEQLSWLHEIVGWQANLTAAQNNLVNLKISLQLDATIFSQAQRRLLLEALAITDLITRFYQTLIGHCRAIELLLVEKGPCSNSLVERAEPPRSRLEMLWELAAVHSLERQVHQELEREYRQLTQRLISVKSAFSGRPCVYPSEGRDLWHGWYLA